MQNCPPLTLTPQQQLVCAVRREGKWRLTRTEQMDCIIGLLAKLANFTLSCETLQALAAEYNCLPPGAMTPAIIYLLEQILANGGGGGGGCVCPPDNISYAGPPVVNPPALQNIVVDVNGRQWQFFGNQWN